jgi:Integral membrane protein CcmA involved in cell shape determination
MFFRRKAAPKPQGARLFGGRVEEAPASVIGKNTRFRGEVHGSGPLVIRGQVEGTLQMDGRLSLESGSSLRADVHVPEMVLAGEAEGEIHVRELLSVRSTGALRGAVESGCILVEEGAVVRGTVRRRIEPTPPPPEQSTP